MSLESNRTLGGVGALLIAVGSFFPILSLVGIILVLVAMKGLAEYYNEAEIFENALYGFIFGIIGIVAFIVIFFSVFVGGIFVFEPPYFMGPSAFAVVALLVALLVMFIFFLVQAIFYKKSFTMLSDKTGEKMFDTAGLLLLIGAVLTIIIVGVVLLFVAWILATVAFFSIRVPVTQVSAAPPPTAPVVTAERRFCQYCGVENRTDAVFCQKCGKKIALK